jgi:ABC-type uncharacterized transport system permease subunit
MEKLLFRLIAFGFALLTLTVLSGVVFSEQLFGTPPQDGLHHAVLAAVRPAPGRPPLAGRGRTALSFTLAGFAILLLAYVGSRFVLEVVLHRVLT